MTIQVGDKAPNYSLKNSNASKGGEVLTLSDSMDETDVLLYSNATIAHT